MPLPAGTKLGPHEILAAIGSGGMGEVYKARDTRLDRTVAIKVLPTHLADRAELRERFEREAKTIASLNHPHICTLYDTGHQDGVDFLVMEYIEGETLAQRLQRGALPIQQVLQFAIEIADALDKAHRKGITHRDLKPGNIMLTKSGTKLLDFGLAKLAQEAVPAVPDSQLPTLQSAITGEGAILGTLQYMAPEQVEGKQNEIDARTDIFAFGAVVYEMATGKKAFDGKTSASVMAKILESEPPSMASLQPMTPPALDRVVKKCLAKEPEKRWQAASDVCDELKWIAEGGSQAGLAPSAAAKGMPRSGRWGMIAGASALLLIAVIAGLAARNRKFSAPPQPVARYVITVPATQELAVTNGSFAHMMAISPDGRHIAYVAVQTSAGGLYLREADSLEPRLVSGPEDAEIEYPFFSPDSHWVGYLSGEGKLKKVPVSGGQPIVICDANARTTDGVAWGTRGNIIFGRSDGLWQVPESGGTPKQLTSTASGSLNHHWPSFLPGSNAVLFAADAGGSPQIAVLSLDTGKWRNLIGGIDPSYSPSGHLLFVQAGTLMAVPFDLQRLEITGEPVPVVEGLVMHTPSSALTPSTDYSLSSNGTLVYVPGSARTAPVRLEWVSRDGAELTLPAPPHAYVIPKISPDGKRIAIGIAEKESQIYIYDLARDTLNRFTFQGPNNLVPSWTPDGKRIAFNSASSGPRNIFWQLADGTGGLDRLNTSPQLSIPGSWSPDGKTLAYSIIDPNLGYDIWTLTPSDHKTHIFLQTKANENAPQFSPDGRWMAYSSDESGRYEIYVVPYPGLGGKWQISSEGGREPLWNRNGRELFFRNGTKMMAAPIDTQQGFSASTPKMLFQGQYVTLANSTPNYDVTADGQKFLMLKSTVQPAQINVVVNWFEELNQKVPAGRK
jgi:Tol biopolymer transport system component/tRNA A-37 threonylcarbamoyl transferase component Bud32